MNHDYYFYSVGAGGKITPCSRPRILNDYCQMTIGSREGDLTVYTHICNGEVHYISALEKLVEIDQIKGLNTLTADRRALQIYPFNCSLTKHEAEQVKKAFEKSGVNDERELLLFLAGRYNREENQ